MKWQRARNEDQIEQRSDAILQAAAELLTHYRVDEITFAMIGKKAKFTRSNLYRYFTTKEEVFLQLLANDIHQWREQAINLLKTKKLSPKHFSTHWVALLLTHRRLLTLFGLLYSLLEKNVSDEKFKQFKRAIDDDIQLITAAFLQYELFSNAQKAQQFLLTHTSLVSGMFAMIAMPEHQQALMAEMNLSVKLTEIETTLVQGVEALYQFFSS